MAMNSGPQNMTIWAREGSAISTAHLSWIGHDETGPRLVFAQS
ncbi:hypothetical protein ACVIDN_005399 [Rhizobium brockwellii]